MRKSLLLGIASLFTLACSHKDTEVEVYIEGKWYYVSQTINGEKTAYVQRNGENRYCEIAEGDLVILKEVADYMVLTENGRYDQYYYENCQLQTKPLFTYSVRHDMLFLFTTPNGKHYADVLIKELTTSKMILEFNADQNGDGIAEHILQEFKRY